MAGYDYLKKEAKRVEMVYSSTELGIHLTFIRSHSNLSQKELPEVKVINMRMPRNPLKIKESLSG
ncbi:MAG: hypothetical protein ACRECH_04540 [Nitrososphaerales archaeon]